MQLKESVQLTRVEEVEPRFPLNGECWAEGLHAPTAIPHSFPAQPIVQLGFCGQRA